MDTVWSKSWNLPTKEYTGSQEKQDTFHREFERYNG
jgi:hypothetical protein